MPSKLAEKIAEELSSKVNNYFTSPYGVIPFTERDFYEVTAEIIDRHLEKENLKAGTVVGRLGESLKEEVKKEIKEIGVHAFGKCWCGTDHMKPKTATQAVAESKEEEPMSKECEHEAFNIHQLRICACCGKPIGWIETPRPEPQEKKLGRVLRDVYDEWTSKNYTFYLNERQAKAAKAHIIAEINKLDLANSDRELVIKSIQES